MNSSIDTSLLDAVEAIKEKMNKTVLEIASENASEFVWSHDFTRTVASITLYDVALRGEASWEITMHKIIDFNQEFPAENLEDLLQQITTIGKRKFTESWLFNKLTRYNVLTKLAERMIQYREKWVIDTDFEAMCHWAQKYFEGENWPRFKKESLVGDIFGLELVDVQYLLMRCNVRTIKPDGRFKEVLSNLEIKYENDYEVIEIGHRLADMLSISPLVLDQLFW
jgi:hypothetical protein